MVKGGKYLRGERGEQIFVGKKVDEILGGEREEKIWGKVGRRSWGGRGEKKIPPPARICSPVLPPFLRCFRPSPR